MSKTCMGSQHLQPLEDEKKMKKKSTAEEYKNVSDVVSRIDSICLNCPTCHFHAFAEDLGPAPGSNWGTAKQDAVQAELLLAVDLPSARCTVGGYDTHQEDLAGCGLVFPRAHTVRHVPIHLKQSRHKT